MTNQRSDLHSIGLVQLALLMCALHECVLRITYAEDFMFIKLRDVETLQPKSSAHLCGKTSLRTSVSGRTCLCRASPEQSADVS